jgi:coenzyme F420 hydrogenase subunit beta
MLDIEDIGSPARPRATPVGKPYRLKDVVTNGLCMGCGLCVSVVADCSKLRMDVDETHGRSRPFFKDDEPLPNEALALAVCPGIKVDPPPPHAIAADDPVSHRSLSGYSGFLGPLTSVRKCYASDPVVRHRAAAGGGLTALCEYLLASKQVDFVHHVRANSRRPMRSVTQESSDKAGLLAGSQSRYGPTAPLENLVQLLDQGRPFAFVGKPCDINGLYNLGRHDPRVKQLVRCTLTISCGMIGDGLVYRRWLESKGLDEAALETFRYRGDGCPGASPFARTADGKEAAQDYRQFWYDQVCVEAAQLQLACSTAVAH